MVDTLKSSHQNVFWFQEMGSWRSSGGEQLREQLAVSGEKPLEGRKPRRAAAFKHSESLFLEVFGSL